MLLEFFGVQSKVAKILECTDTNEINDELIKQCICGISIQGIKSISLEAPKYEILMRCKRGVDKGLLLEKTYSANKSFIIFKSVLSYLSNNPHLDVSRHNLNLNVHPRDFLHDDFDTALAEVFEKNNEYPNICLEILEVGFSSDEEREMVKTKICEVRTKYGFKFAIDDYSDTQEMRGDYDVLKELIDCIKIDGEFFQEIVESSKTDGIVPNDISHEAFSALQELICQFKSDGKTIVIEGVEDWEHHNISHLLCVDFLQGFFYGKPSAI